MTKTKIFSVVCCAVFAIGTALSFIEAYTHFSSPSLVRNLTDIGNILMMISAVLLMTTAILYIVGDMIHANKDD